MRKLAYIVFMAMMIALLASGCFKMVPTAQFETEEAIFILKNGSIEVKAAKELSGLEVFLKAKVEESEVSAKGTCAIVKQFEDGTYIATAIGGMFKSGETVMTIRGGFTDLNKLSIETMGVKIEEEYGPQSQVPEDGVYVQDTWVSSGSIGNKLVIGAKNLNIGDYSDTPINGFSFVVEYDPADIEITGVENKVSGPTISEIDYTSTTGELNVCVGYPDESGVFIVAPTELLEITFNSKNVKTVSQVTLEDVQVTVYDSNSVWNPVEISADATDGFITIGDPKLLGDFDLDGIVGTADLAVFATYYRETYSGEAEAPAYYDIGPAKKTYGGVWANIYTEANPDFKVDLLDLVIMAQNWAVPKPTDFNYVKTLAELNAAIASNAFSPIVLGADIDGTDGISVVSRIVDINLNGYTLTGNLSFDTGDSGTINLYAGTIAGDLTVDAPNATFNNYADVTGNVVINDISGSTWNEYAEGNKIVWDAENKTLHVFGSVASVTINKNGTTITGAGNIGKLIIPEGVSVSVDEAPQSVDLPDQKIWNPTKGEFYSTISNAIDGASAGDTIFVGSGEYNEIFQINKQDIKLIGEGYEDPPYTKINGGIAVTKANVEISGFMISGGGTAYSNAKAGIYIVRGTTGHKITGNKLVGNGNNPASGPGILFGYNASNVEINSNVIMNWYQGMYVNPSSNIVIEGNTFESNYVGIGSDGLNDVSIVRNQFKNNIVEDWGSSNVGVDVSAKNNTFVNTGTNTSYKAVAHYSGQMINATCNWWGSIDPVVIAGKVSGLVNWSPFWTTAEGPCNGEAPVRNITTGLPYTTIQAAVDSASEGHEIEVNDGTYSENVTINKNIKLLSRNGRDFTRIVGMNESGLGTIDVLTGTNGLQIGDHGKGFEIVGINGNGAIEKAAIYFRGSHTNAKIIGNKVVANGDAGLMAEYNAGVTDFLIEGNIFSGKTFTGDKPEGEGFTDQFLENSNYPRQLVVFGGGASGTNTQRITFKDNFITGTAGGINEEGAEQGNTLVTIDADGSVITGNDFKGVTSRYGTSLRARRSCTIQGNTFHSDGLTNTAGHLFVQNQGKTLDEIASDNTFDRHVFISGSNTIGHRISPFLLAAIQGNTVKVGAGNYDEAITIIGKTDITIQGAGQNCTIMKVQNSDSVTLTDVSGITIKDIGFDYERPNIGLDGHRAIQMTGTNSNIRIENCHFKNGYYVTIQGKADNLTVSGCNITNVKSGINLQYGTNLVVEDTDISVVAQGETNDTYCVRFGSDGGTANRMSITRCEFSVNKKGLTASEGTYHSAIVVRKAATGVLAANESKILGEVVNLSSTSLNAAYNYWGHATGPEEGQIKGTGTVVYAPYYSDEGMTDPVLAVFRFDADAELVGWYTDRTEPAAFTTVPFDGDRRLKHSVSESPLPSTDFYQYTGKKLDTPEAAYYSIELYIPADWENSKTVRAGIWATGKDSDDEISLYPIVEFTNNPKDDNDSASPRFRVWPVDASAGDWIDICTDITYNSWYTLTMELDTNENKVTFTVGNNSTTLGANGTVQLANVILQGHNPLPSGATYDIYWDNLIIKP